VLADGEFREQIGDLLKKSLRNHERFLAHFDAHEIHRCARHPAASAAS